MEEGLASLHCIYVASFLSLFQKIIVYENGFLKIIAIMLVHLSLQKKMNLAKI